MSSPTSDLKHRASESIPASGDREGSVIVAAYNAIAPSYDSQLKAAQWIRDRLWARMDALFCSGSHLLDVTAGTGLDALYLSARGVEVVACDISPAMLVQLHAKNPNIETRIVDFNDLNLDGEFDGIISTFAGLNTSPNLYPFAECTVRLLRPGGTLLIHLLNRWPLLDIARQFTRLHWRACWRTIISTQRDVNVSNVIVPHYLYSPLSLYRKVFAEHFRLSRIEGQGFIRPWDIKPGSRIDGMERRLATTFPFHSFGIFFSIEMTRV